MRDTFDVATALEALEREVDFYEYAVCTEEKAVISVEEAICYAWEKEERKQTLQQKRARVTATQKKFATWLSAALLVESVLYDVDDQGVRNPERVLVEAEKKIRSDEYLDGFFNAIEAIENDYYVPYAPAVTDVLTVARQQLRVLVHHSH